MHIFTIKDIENLSGIKAHTIRVWEQRYSFLKPERTETNIRYYSSQQLKSVLDISLLYRHGFKISHIDRMNECELQEKIISLSGAQAGQERIINEMIRQMVDLDMDDFEQLIDRQISLQGIDKTIRQVMFPFLNRVGILWQGKHIHPTQEHLVTNVVRQKLMVAIEEVPPRTQSKKTVLLFLPEGEYQELWLLYVYYLLKSRGLQVLYLGADTPLPDVGFICKFKSPDHFYTHLSRVPAHFSLVKFIAEACECVPSIPFAISGPPSLTFIHKIPPTIHFKKSIPEVLEYIASM